MIALLLLQAVTFQTYVDEARAKLGIDKPIATHVYNEHYPSPEGDIAAFTHAGRIYVWDDALAQASRDAQRVIAYHETCHIYLEYLQDTAKTPFQKHLVHSLQRQCTVETLGNDLGRILRKLGRGTYGSRLGTVRWWRNQCQRSR